GLEGHAEPGLALAQARLAGPQLRFRQLSFRDVMGHAEDVRHIVEVNEFAGDQHDEVSSGAVLEPPLLFADGAGPVKTIPEVLAILLVLPQAELLRSSSQDFLARKTRPIYEGIIHQHISAIAYPRDGDNDWAGLKGRAEARFALD